MTFEELYAHREKERAERAAMAKEAPSVVTPELVTETKDKLSQHAATAIAYRMLGYDVPDIARQMNESEQAVKRHLMAGRRQGVLVDVDDRLNNHAAALAADQLIVMIENGNEKAVIETLKGLGHFRSHASLRTDAHGDRPIQLQVNVEMPAGARCNVNTPLTGQITGTPRRVPAPRGVTTEIDVFPNEMPHAE